MEKFKDSKLWFEITGQPLDPKVISEWVTLDETGATNTFVGTARNHSEGRTGVTQLEYEAYSDAIIGSFSKIAEQARRSWPQLERIAMLHRTGVVKVGEPAVVVAVSAAHRDCIFESCSYLIAELKATAPIWKKEVTADSAEWVGPC